MAAKPPSSVEKEQIFGMAEKEMEYRVELFNKLTHTCFNKCIEKRLLSAKSMNCRCRPSAVRVVLDKVRPTIDDATWNELEAMSLVQFFDLPPYPQDHILTMHIISCWDIDRRAFILGGKEVKFDADKVALLIGMPNRGAPASWCNTPSANMDARKIKTALLSSSPGESSRPFLQLLIKFLMSNLLFPSNNFRVSEAMCTICNNVEAFSSYNWPATVCRSLTEELNVSALKIRKDERLGYLSGFVFLITLWFYEHTTLVLPAVPDARPRMLRWPAKVRWNATKIQLAFERLRPVEVYDFFVDFKDSEHRLLSHLPEEPSSPLKPLPERETQSRTQSPVCVEVATSFPYHVGPQPTDGDTYPQSTPRTGFEEMTELLKDHHKFFLDFQGSVHSRLTNLENTLTELKSEVSEMKKAIIQPSREFAMKWGKVSPQRSLIQRIKAREDRRKRTLRSPFMVFERKKKTKITHEADEGTLLEVEQVPGWQDEPEAVQKGDSPVEQQITTGEMSSDQPTVPFIQIESQNADEQYPAKVETLNKGTLVEFEQVPGGKDKPEAVQKGDSPVEQQITTADMSSDPPTVPFIQIDSQVADEQYPAKVYSAAPVLDFPARLQIPHYMRETIDICCSKFTELYKESELNMGENSCIDRCVSKYWQVTNLVGQLLGSGQQQV